MEKKHGIERYSIQSQPPKAHKYRWNLQKEYQLDRLYEVNNISELK